MFSAAVSVGIKLNAWKITRLGRGGAGCTLVVERAEVDVADPYRPARNVSAGEHVHEVDLPEPDGPMIAVKRPVARSTLTLERGHCARPAVHLDGVNGAGGDGAVAVPPSPSCCAVSVSP